MSEKQQFGTCDHKHGAMFISGRHIQTPSCVNWQPVASPQATRPDAEMQTRILDAAYAQQKRMESAAQPAAGTTPQAERPTDSDWVWWFDREPEDRLRMIRQIRSGQSVEYRPFTSDIENLRPPRAVAPVETPQVELCQICHRENPVWFAPNAVWNAVVTEISGILCPICFINRAEQQGFRCTGWELVPEILQDAPAPTRLTAEQFCPIAKNTSPHFAPTCLVCCMAEAFRDKSEATLIDQLPPTFYADRPLLFRVQQLVRIWQNAVTSNLKLESENTGLQEENERLKREGKQ